MKANILCGRASAALLLLFVCSLSRGDEDGGGGWPSGPYQPPEPWKEATVDLPGWPDAGELLQVDVDNAGFPFDVYLDPESLSVGNDRVVRYTLVIVSSSGARNVSFEGLRCATREYRRYAYGSGDAWLQARGTTWHKVLDGGMDGYRYILYRDYLCDPLGDDLEVNEILEKVRYSRGSYLEE